MSDVWYISNFYMFLSYTLKYNLLKEWMKKIFFNNNDQNKMEINDKEFDSIEN